MQAIKEQNNLMDEQLKFMDENHLEIRMGKILTGEVISINSKEAVINLNYKSDGILPISEVTSDFDTDLTTLFNIGDIVRCKIIKLKDSDGNVVLSTKELKREEGYTQLKESSEQNKIIKVFVKESVKGGFICNFKGIKVFMPSSLSKLNTSNDVNEIVGTTVEVTIAEYKKVKNNFKIIVSRKQILEEEKARVQEKAWESIVPNTIVEGVVKRISEFGAFVDVNGIDGLLHISELSWSKVESVSSVLKIGQTVKVYILNADKDANKLSLSLKRTLENPWTNIKERYPIGTIVLGKALKFVAFGAFVELEPGVEALLHISQISHTRVNKIEDVLKLNDSIKVKIIDVNPDKKKISISTKELMDI